jgi:hypothetical protein
MFSEVHAAAIRSHRGTLRTGRMDFFSSASASESRRRPCCLHWRLLPTRLLSSCRVPADLGHPRSGFRSVSNHGDAALHVGLTTLLLSLCGPAAGDPRTTVAGQTCAPGAALSGSLLADNFVPAMDQLNTNVSAHGFGTSAVGSGGPNMVFGLGQCLRDLSPVDCKLCFAEVRSLLPKCYPRVGGRLYLDGCFGRYANYSFFGEAVDATADAITCGAGSRQPRAFGAAVGAGDPGVRGGLVCRVAPRLSRSRSAGRASTPPPARSASAPRPTRWRGARRRRRDGRSSRAATSATPPAGSGMSMPRRRQVRRFPTIFLGTFFRSLASARANAFQFNSMLLDFYISR